MILHNGRVATLSDRGFTSSLAIKDGRFLAVGSDQEMMRYKGDKTELIDLGRRTVIPGLNDSHTHVIRGGLNYNMELRWDGIHSLGEALQMLREQAQRTPPPQWIRVVGGWSEFQFKEKRMPSLGEINAAAPDTPVFILHLYSSALLNRAALRALGYDQNPPVFDRGEVARDAKGRPTGMLIAKPSALILYKTLSMGPRLESSAQINSSRQFMRELNRLGITSVIDAGGGGQSYPEDYRIIEELAKRGELTLRIAYNLFAQNPGREFDDYERWIGMTMPGEGSDMLLMNGAGENLTWPAADFENFLQPRPDLQGNMDAELKRIVKLLAVNRWPFRIHATYNESINRFLNVFERVDREIPFNGLRWFIDHAETISDRNIERVRALGGGIAIQHRMAFQGEYFIDRYGTSAAGHTPPIRRMLEIEVPVGAGTDATRVASYNPWVSLYWLVTGKTVGGTSLYPKANRLERMEALRLWTAGSSWFSGEQNKKGTIFPGQLADLTVLSADYFSVPEEKIKEIESVLTILGGKVVYGSREFARLSPPPLPVSPDWSPVRVFGGYGGIRGKQTSATMAGHIPANPKAWSRDSMEKLRAALVPGFINEAKGLWDPGCTCFAL
jgi:predicted amidohydrolase YtcJ